MYRPIRKREIKKYIQWCEKELDKWTKERNKTRTS